MTVSLITKSVRFLPEESEELATLSRISSVSEAALMKQWILDGIQTKRIEMAVQAYQERKIDLREGARMAKVPYSRFLQEVEARRVVILDNDYFLDELDLLAENFDSQSLRKAVARISKEPTL